MESCIYEGRVKHTRTDPVLHRFSYRMFMMYLDLDELPTLFRKRWLWSATRPALARFRREDHLGASDEPLSESIRSLVERQTGTRPKGPIRVLTNLSYFGYCFNPVSFYYCFDREGRDVEAIVVEIHNTPWGELFCYVLGEQQNAGTQKEKKFRLSKDFHISPFMDMDMRYEWQFTDPGDSVHVLMTSYRNGNMLFDAELSMERREMTGPQLSRMLTKYPFMNVKIIWGIYWQALRLKIKGAKFYTHPSKRNNFPESRVP